MTTSRNTKADVLVIGGGPVGLTMASELLRHGISCRIVEKLAEPVIWSKAAGIQPRTLEVFEDMGIVKDILALGRPMYGFNMYVGMKRFAHATLDIHGTSYPYILGLSQRETEAILTAHLETLGGRLEREVELLSFQEEGEGVRATLQHKDGTQEEVVARWLVGCDGAHSTVRKVLGLPFEGSTFEQRLIQADLRVKFPFEVDPNEAIAFISNDGPFGFLPLLSEGRYRLLGLNSAEGLLEPTFNDFLEMAKARAPEGLELSDPSWMIGFRFHGRIVPDYRAGRVFLAGDAAHIHSPVGAQGMNMGIQDAYNLAWKLAYVMHGWAAEELLASYNVERRPVGLAVVQTTDRVTKGAMRVMTLRSPVAQAFRNQAAGFLMGTGFFQHRVAEAIGGLTVGYPKSPVVAEHQISGWNVHLGDARRGEQPSLPDWWAFHQGCQAGQRVPDLEFEDGEQPVSSLYALLSGSMHVLLLFDGTEHTAEGYDNLSTIAEEARTRFGAFLAIYVVTPEAEKPEALRWDGTVLFDKEMRLHAHFGSLTESLYLVRPDGYVGFRSQPADKDALMQYLQRWFVSAPL